MANRNKKIVQTKETGERKEYGKPRRSKKPTSRREKPERDNGECKEVNEIRWWFKNKDLFEQSAQLSFQSIVGWHGILSTYDTPCNMLVVPLNPCPGVTPSTVTPTGINDTALNMQALKLYQQLSMHSGRTATYAPQDVSTLLLALGELLSISEHIRRFFGIACIYNERNWTMPELVCKRLGINSTDLFANLASYRMRFNTDITRLNTLPILASLPYFAKCMSLYKDVYVEGQSPMSSLWAYVPMTTWTLDETTFTGGSILKTTPIYANSVTGGFTAQKTMAQLLSTFENMITSLFNSSTLQIIYSDILNLASKNELALMKVDYCFETYQVMPVYSDEANLHLRHAFVFGIPNWNPTNYPTTWGEQTPLNDVWPDAANNKLTYNPCIENNYLWTGNGNKAHPLLINFYDTGNPSLDAKIEATRFMGSYSGDSVTIDSVSYAHNMVMPDHYVVVVYAFLKINDLPTSGVGITTSNWKWNTTSASDMTNIARRVIELDKISCHPYIYFFDTSAARVDYLFADPDFYTSVDIEYIRRMNQLTQQTLYDYTN